MANTIFFFLKLTSHINHDEAEIFEIFLWLVRLTSDQVA